MIAGVENAQNEGGYTQSKLAQRREPTFPISIWLFCIRHGLVNIKQQKFLENSNNFAGQLAGYCRTNCH